MSSVVRSFSLDRQRADGVGGEQEAVVLRAVDALVHAEQRVDQDRRLRVAEADILDRDDLQPGPQLLLELRAGDEHLPAEQHGVVDEAAADGFLQRRDHLVGRQAVLGGGALPGVGRLLDLGHRELPEPSWRCC